MRKAVKNAIIKLREKGWTIQHIASSLKLSYNTVKEIIEKEKNND